jgi:hypothetical protein
LDLPDGIGFSTIDAFSVTGVSAMMNLIAFTPTTLGSTTSGTWSLYLILIRCRSHESASEETNAVSIDS